MFLEILHDDKWRKKLLQGKYQNEIKNDGLEFWLRFKDWYARLELGSLCNKK